MPTIATTMSAAKIAELVRSLPGRMAATVSDPEGVGAGFRARLAFVWYSKVKQAFDIKSKHGTDEAGESWAPNTPEYLAYGKGPKSSRMGRGSMPNNRPADVKNGGPLARGRGTGELNREDIRQWWAMYMQNLPLFAARMPLREAKASAAAIAWNYVKAHGAGTLLQRFGQREDTILVDEGTLRRSFQVGSLVEQGATADYRSKEEDQIFEESPGRVVVGSRAKTAAIHHKGKGRNPVRRLWPRTMPASWWNDIKEQMLVGLVRLTDLVRSGRL